MLIAGMAFICFFYCRPGIYISCLTSSGNWKESALDRWSVFCNWSFPVFFNSLGLFSLG